MALSLRAVAGDWGGSQPSDVEAVARSAASCFPVFDDGETIAVVIEPTPSHDDPPILLTTPNSAGELVIRLNVRGNLWARLAYQFAHELGHVIADIGTWRGGGDRFAWIEEALCETASLYALRSMAETWAAAPPFEQWRDYAPALAAYDAEHRADPARTLPPGVPFSAWLGERLPLFEADAGRREDNTVVARELLPVFERGRPTTWRAVRSLHAWTPPPEANLADFLRHWAAACPAGSAGVVASISEILRVEG